jgi:hypothetical protein
MSGTVGLKTGPDKMLANTRGVETWQRFVESQVWEKGHRDQPSYWAFLRAATLGIDPQTALSTVADCYSTSGAHPPPGKLEQQIRRAYRFARSQQSVHPQKLPKEERQIFVPDYARKFADRVPSEVNLSWLRRRSPVKVPWILTPAEFLFSVF